MPRKVRTHIRASANRNACGRFFSTSSFPGTFVDRVLVLPTKGLGHQRSLRRECHLEETTNWK